MLTARKTSRQFLKDCSRSEYNAVTYDAKLTPTQKQIADMFIVDRLTICEISLRLACCESIIRRRLSEIYDKVAKL